MLTEATEPLPRPGRPRLHFVDLFRGLLMAHMALDHASLFFNRARFANEYAHARPAPPADLWQFLTRFTGVFVAPGFSFMAGFMIAVTSGRRSGRGLDEGAITRRLMLRGLILIAAEAVLLGLPAGRWAFEVLSCLGASMILVALVRRWPTAVLLPLALAIMALHPLLEAGRLPFPIAQILHDPRDVGGFHALYPVVPWVGVMLFGFVCGRDFQSDPAAIRRWLLGALAFAGLFLAVRLPGGYGNAYGYERVWSYDFFVWAKYPPDLAWLTWSFLTIFLLLALLMRFQESAALNSAPARFVATFGRVPLFFYLLHFIVLGSVAMFVVPGLAHRQPLWAVYAVWAALLVLLWWPCRAYFALRERNPQSIWKYL